MKLPRLAQYLNIRIKHFPAEELLLPAGFVPNNKDLPEGKYLRTLKFVQHGQNEARCNIAEKIIKKKLYLQ